MNIPNTFYIYGKKPVEEILQSRTTEVEKVFIKNTISPNSYQHISEIAEDNQIPVVKVPVQKISNLVGRVNDQGFVALLSQIKYLKFFEWFETLEMDTKPAVLLLDGIEDPHNMGAIIRSATAAGISAIIIPMQNQTPINATVFKTSAGTAGLIPVIRVHDTNQGYKDLKLAGFSIVGLHGNAQKTFWNTTFDAPTAFLIGNEGKGINKKLISGCDEVVNFPMENNVESLNASVSAALICYEWKRQRSQS